MAQVQLEIPDEEHERFLRQAQEDGLTLSEWMTKAADSHLKSLGLLDSWKRYEPFKSAEEVREFFRRCDEVTKAEGPEREPDWEEHKKVIHEGKMAVWTGT